MGLILFAFVAILIVWTINRWYSRASIKLANNIPSNKWHTILGCGKILRPKDVLSNAYEFANKYGPNGVFWLGPYPLFLTTDPQTLKEVLTAKNCVDKPLEFYNGFASISGQGLITNSDPIWSQHRKLLNKAFSNKNLVSFLPSFQSSINNYIVGLEKRVDMGEELDILLILRILSLHSATKTTLKRNFGLTKLDSTLMAKHFEQMLHFVSDITVFKFLNNKWVRKLADTLIYQSARDGINMFSKLVHDSLNLAQTVDATDSSYLAKENSIIDHVLHSKEENSLIADDLQGIVGQLFVAAFETTSTTLYFALSLLAMHPQYQERAHQEITKLLAESDHDNELTINQLDQFTYLDMIFNETMRVMPIVPMVFRKVSNQNLTLSNGMTLPCGQIICIDIFRLHRSKEIWGPEAEVFNPDNFLPSNTAARHPYAFIPFTKGQRFCIGWRYGSLFFKIALAKLITKFKFATDSELNNLRFENHITLKIVEQPRLKLERRNA